MTAEDELGDALRTTGDQTIDLVRIVYIAATRDTRHRACRLVDTGGGWLIFRAGPAELAVHPTSGDDGWSSPPHHEISLMCDEVEATTVELSARGAEFTRPVRDDGWGLTTAMAVPGAGEITLYEPRHSPAYDL